MVHHGIAASDRDALRASSACFCSAASTALPSKLQNGDKNQGTKMSNQLKSDLNKTLLSSCGVPPIYSNRSINYCEAVLTLKLAALWDSSDARSAHVFWHIMSCGLVQSGFPWWNCKRK